MTRPEGQPPPSRDDLRKRPSYWLYLVRLHCHKTEDNLGGDEAYITINGITRWGIQTVNDGETVYLEALTEPANFRTSVSVALWDNDTGIWDDDDKLGEHVIRPDENFPFGQEQEHDFTDDEAHYTLTFSVEK